MNLLIQYLIYFIWLLLIGYFLFGFIQVVDYVYILLTINKVSSNLIKSRILVHGLFLLIYFGLLFLIWDAPIMQNIFALYLFILPWGFVYHWFKIKKMIKTEKRDLTDGKDNIEKIIAQ